MISRHDAGERGYVTGVHHTFWTDDISLSQTEINRMTYGQEHDRFWSYMMNCYNTVYTTQRATKDSVELVLNLFDFLQGNQFVPSNT